MKFRIGKLTFNQWFVFSITYFVIIAWIGISGIGVVHEAYIGEWDITGTLLGITVIPLVSGYFSEVEYKW